MPKEAIYAEVMLSEVQEFISALFGALLRFYQPVVKHDDLDDITEDLVAIVTSLTIGKELSPWLLKLCQLSSRSDEVMLQDVIKKYGQALPEQIGIGEYFTLNGSSKLFGILTEVEQQVK